MCNLVYFSKTSSPCLNFRHFSVARFWWAEDNQTRGPDIVWPLCPSEQYLKPHQSWALNVNVKTFNTCLNLISLLLFFLQIPKNSQMVLFFCGLAIDQQSLSSVDILNIWNCFVCVMKENIYYIHFQSSIFMSYASYLLHSGWCNSLLWIVTWGLRRRTCNLTTLTITELS